MGRAINSKCTTLVERFTYNSVHDVVALIEPGFVMTVVDIQAAYRAVPIFPDHHQYLGFRWFWHGKDRYFVDNRLCFGLSTGPYYFNSISCLLAEFLKSNFGIALVHYLDDYIIVAPNMRVALEGQRLVISTLRYVGFYLSWQKI